MIDKTYITELMVATGIASMFIAGAFGTFGAVIHLCYLVIKEEIEFTKTRLFYFAIMGFFVGLTIDQLMREQLDKSYPGVILVSGFLFLKILEFLDIRGLDYLTKRLPQSKVEEK